MRGRRSRSRRRRSIEVCVPQGGGDETAEDAEGRRGGGMRPETGNLSEECAARSAAATVLGSSRLSQRKKKRGVVGLVGFECASAHLRPTACRRGDRSTWRVDRGSPGPCRFCKSVRALLLRRGSGIPRDGSASTERRAWWRANSRCCARSGVIRCFARIQCIVALSCRCAARRRGTCGESGRAGGI